MLEIYLSNIHYFYLENIAVNQTSQQMGPKAKSASPTTKLELHICSQQLPLSQSNLDSQRVSSRSV